MPQRPVSSRSERRGRAERALPGGGGPSLSYDRRLATRELRHGFGALVRKPKYWPGIGVCRSGRAGTRSSGSRCCSWPRPSAGTGCSAAGSGSNTDRARAHLTVAERRHARHVRAGHARARRWCCSFGPIQVDLMQVPGAAIVWAAPAAVAAWFENDALVSSATTRASRSGRAEAAGPCRRGRPSRSPSAPRGRPPERRDSARSRSPSCCCRRRPRRSRSCSRRWSCRSPRAAASDASRTRGDGGAQRATEAHVRDLDVQRRRVRGHPVDPADDLREAAAAGVVEHPNRIDQACSGRRR